MKPIGNGGTDVATCKTWDERLVAVATVGCDPIDCSGEKGKQHPGRVVLFTVDTAGTLTEHRTISTVGSLPDQIQWTKDCRKIIAAIEGEAVADNTADPKFGTSVSSAC